jgi:hypothetical protein
VDLRHRGRKLRHLWAGQTPVQSGGDSRWQTGHGLTSVDTNNNNTGNHIDYSYTVTPTASQSEGAAEAATTLEPFDPYIRNLP